MFIAQRIIIGLVLCIQINMIASQINSNIPLEEITEQNLELLKQLINQCDGKLIATNNTCTELQTKLKQKTDEFNDLEARLKHSHKLLQEKAQECKKLIDSNNNLSVLEKDNQKLIIKLEASRKDLTETSDLMNQYFSETREFEEQLKESNKAIEKLKRETDRTILQLTQENKKYQQDIEKLTENFNNAEKEYVSLDHEYRKKNPEDNELLLCLKHALATLRSLYDYDDISVTKNWVANMPFKQLQNNINHYLDKFVLQFDFIDQTIAENIRYRNDATWYKRISLLMAAIAVFASAYLYKNQSVHHV